jgi:ribosomal 50S subunit-recycling heat shock protein
MSLNLSARVKAQPLCHSGERLSGTVLVYGYPVAPVKHVRSGDVVEMRLEHEFLEYEYLTSERVVESTKNM